MRFATDASLGKLGRLLRAAGFDTHCEHESGASDFWRTIAPDRIVLTRTRRIQTRLKGRRLIFVMSNDPAAQLRQVIGTLNIGPADVAPFCRCLCCNTPIRRMDRQAARGRVPDYVWQVQTDFHTCDRCKRIYWAGSHHERMCRRFDMFFKHKDAIYP